MRLFRNQLHGGYSPQSRHHSLQVDFRSGDYNDDGIVDASDYVTWRKFNGTSTDLPNDPNPVPIDIDQYNTWRTNFGEPSGGAGGNTDESDAAVPEPNALLILAIGLAIAPMGRRHAAGAPTLSTVVCVRYD
jgi:hypothetical protein